MENYIYFLEKYRIYISPIADMLAYCLLPNHFHFLVRLKEFDIQQASPTRVLNPLRAVSQQYSTYISRSFSNLFNTYAQAFNKQENRKGSLFKNRFKHILIDKDDYLLNLILYIHLNPIHHSICKSISEWRFSSYKAIISNKPTQVRRDIVLDLFKNTENFIYCHEEKQFELLSEYKLE